MISEVLRFNLLALATAYARATGQPLSTVSYKFYGNAWFFEEFRRKQRSVSIRMLDVMFRRFAAEWPEGEPWPVLKPLKIVRKGSRITI